MQALCLASLAMATRLHHHVISLTVLISRYLRRIKRQISNPYHLSCWLVIHPLYLTHFSFFSASRRDASLKRVKGEDNVPNIQ